MKLYLRFLLLLPAIYIGCTTPNPEPETIGTYVSSNRMDWMKIDENGTIYLSRAGDNEESYKYFGGLFTYGVHDEELRVGAYAENNIQDPKIEFSEDFYSVEISWSHNPLSVLKTKILLFKQL